MHWNAKASIAPTSSLALALALLAPSQDLVAQSATPLGQSGTPPTANSDPSEFLEFGPFRYFLATDDGGNRAVFRTAGTVFSTGMAISPTTARAVESLSAGATKLYFAADSTGGPGRSLFVSTGTDAGTLELAPAPEEVSTTTVGDRLVAVEGQAAPSRNVIVSDGTVAGTTSIAFGSTPPIAFTSAIPRLVRGEDMSGNEAAFILATGQTFPSRTIEAFVSDGTVAGTTAIAVSPPTTSIYLIRAIVPFAPGRVLVVAAEPGRPTRVLVIDQAAGTFASVGTLPLAVNIAEIPAAVFDGRVVLFPFDGSVFAADGAGVVQPTLAGQPLGNSSSLLGVLGGSLWATTETPGGLRLVRLDPGSNSFVDVAGLTTQPSVGPGSALGSSFVVPVRGADSSSPFRQNRLVRIDVPSGQVTELATAPTNARVGDSAVVNGRVLFRGFDDRGIEPWLSDGTVAGTHILADLRTAPDFSTTPQTAGFVPFGNRTVFVSSPSGSTTIFSTDGTGSGTTRETPLLAIGQIGGALVEGRETLWARWGPNLLAIDGAASSVTEIPAGLPSNPAAFGSDALFFDQIAGRRLSLARADGTSVPLSAQASSVGEILSVFGESAYFWTDGDLFETDGTPAGTTSVATGVMRPSEAAPFDGELWYAEGTATNQLTATDGTNVRLLQLGAFVRPALLLPADGFLVGADNDEIFVTDGSSVSVATTPAGVGVNTAAPLAALGGRVLFRSLSGLELWAADATPTGFSFSALTPGRPTIEVTPVSRELAYLVVGATPTGPFELWRTDGTPLGTTFVQSLVDVRDLVASNGVLYFNADDGSGNGYQPFVLRPEVFNLPVGQSCSGHPTGTHTLRTDVDPRVGRNVQLIGRSRFAGNGTGQVAGIFLGTASDVVTPLAMSRCEFRLDFSRPIAAITLPVDPAGNFQVGLQIPNLPALAGLELTLQAAIAPSPSPIGIDLTNGLHWVVGG
jgi:ELWxxDGT repeat protein